MSQSILKILADFDTQLAAPVAVGATSATLVSATDDDGIALPTGTYGFTIDNGNSSKEFFICTLTSTALTSVVSISRQGAATSGFARAHRRGAKVIVSDWAELDRIVKLLNGTTNFDAGTPLGYDGTASITGANQFATKAYVDATATGSATYDQEIIAGIAGETLAAGNLCYFKEADARWWLCDAGTANTVQGVLLGFAQGTATAGNAVSILRAGLEKNQSGMTPGSKYYASNTAGGISSSAGTTEVYVGNSYTATQLIVDFRWQDMPTALEKAALAGTSGTPSASNKFVTSNDVATTSTASKIPRADANGKLDSSWINGSGILHKGGDGSDGALTISSGTTNIDLGGASLVVKNYTSVSITGTGALTFSNPSANGTCIVFRVQGAVTITSSANPVIDLRNLGSSAGTAGAGGTGGIGTDGTDATVPIWKYTALYTNTIAAALKGPRGTGNNPSAIAGAAGTVPTTVVPFTSTQLQRWFLWETFVASTSGGGAGAGGGYGGTSGGGIGGAGAAGGRGAGTLIIESAGDYTFTTGTINAAGANGSNAGAVTGSGGGGGGGGGGAGGIVMVFASSITTSGTVTVTGGNGGNGSAAVNAGTGNNGGAAGGGGGSNGLYAGGAGGVGGTDGTIGANNPGTAGGGTGGGTGGTAGGGGAGTHGSGNTFGSGGGGGGGAAGIYLTLAL